MALELDDENMAGGNRIEKWEKIYKLERFIKANTNVIRRFDVVPSVDDNPDDEEDEGKEGGGQEGNEALSDNDFPSGVDPDNEA